MATTDPYIFWKNFMYFGIGFFVCLILWYIEVKKRNKVK